MGSTWLGEFLHLFPLLISFPVVGMATGWLLLRACTGYLARAALQAALIWLQLVLRFLLAAAILILEDSFGEWISAICDVVLCFLYAATVFLAFRLPVERIKAFERSALHQMGTRPLGMLQGGLTLVVT